MICPAASPVRDIPLNCAFSPLCFWKCAVFCDLKYKKINHSLEHIKKTFRCDKNVTVQCYSVSEIVCIAYFLIKFE